MRFIGVFNRGGGTLSTLDLEAFCQRTRETLTAAGHGFDCHVVEGDAVVDALRKAAESSGHDVVLAAGGDGTVSAAAGLLMDSDKALAVLPAGTMNLFARSLGVPLDLDRAVEAFAHGRIRQVDVASANGRPFVHQYSIGMHPQTVELRDSMQFSSKFGKRWASAKAATTTFFKPPRMKVALVMKETEILAHSSSISVSNNLYGEGTLPYAENPSGGVLGIYVTRAQRRRDLLWFFLNMAVGRWRGNDQVEIHQTDSVTLSMRSGYRRFKCAIDGELCPLDKETLLRIHKGALKVLVPAQEDEPGPN